VDEDDPSAAPTLLVLVLAAVAVGLIIYTVLVLVGVVRLSPA
jgi:hypothetical protein